MVEDTSNYRRSSSRSINSGSSLFAQRNGIYEKNSCWYLSIKLKGTFKVKFPWQFC